MNWFDEIVDYVVIGHQVFGVDEPSAEPPTSSKSLVCPLTTAVDGTTRSASSTI